MPDISVNIRGRDEGLGSHLDNLRQKARDLGQETEKLNNIQNQSPSQQNENVRDIAHNVRDERKQKVRDEFGAIRAERNEFYGEQAVGHMRGKVSDKDFNKFRNQFEVDEKDLKNQEGSELKQIDKDSNLQLKLILRELQTQRKTTQEEKQRDSKELRDSGLLGNLTNQNADLRGRQMNASNEEEIAQLQTQIDSNNARIRAYRKGDKKDDDDDDRRRNPQGLIGAAGAATSGNAVGAIMQTPNALHQAGITSKEVAIAGGLITATAYAAYQFAKQDENLKERTAPLAAMRGISDRAGAANSIYRGSGNLDPDGLNGNLGMSHEDMIDAMLTKATASGIGGANLRTRALADVGFKKGFGADVGGFSEFERFGGDASSKVGLDILNVLTEINESSLKSNDLVTLSEKLQSGQTIMSIQRQKRDMVNPDDALKIMAAFESIGLSGKGNKSAAFMQQTIDGLGEGGSDNVMMLKFEAAKRANPKLANDPAALRRMIKYHSDDPNYMNESFKMMGELTGGNEMAMDDMLYSFFPGLNEKDMQIYKKAAKDGTFGDLMKGKGLDKMKQRKAGLDGDSMMEDAASGVGTFTKATNDFSNTMTEWSTNMTKFFTPGGPPMNVAVVKDETKGKNAQGNKHIPANGTRPK